MQTACECDHTPTSLRDDSRENVSQFPAPMALQRESACVTIGRLAPHTSRLAPHTSHFALVRKAHDRPPAINP